MVSHTLDQGQARAFGSTASTTAGLRVPVIVDVVAVGVPAPALARHEAGGAALNARMRSACASRSVMEWATWQRAGRNRQSSPARRGHGSDSSAAGVRRPDSKRPRGYEAVAFTSATQAHQDAGNQRQDETNQETCTTVRPVTAPFT